MKKLISHILESLHKDLRTAERIFISFPPTISTPRGSHRVIDDRSLLPAAEERASENLFLLNFSHIFLSHVDKFR